MTTEPSAGPRPAAPVAPSPEGVDWTPWLLGGAGAVLLMLLWLRYQRDTPINAGADADETQPPAVAPPRPGARGAWLTVDLRPVRAGLNMITAVADCEITVTNDGDAPAEAIRTALVLITAHAGQSDEIDAVNADPIARPVLPAFTLAAGESRTFRTVAATPLDALPTMRAGGREMLVPLVVVNLQHRDPAGIECRTSQSFVLGVERVDSSKLAPFWLDSVRMIDQVAARASGAAQRRRVTAGEGGGVGYIS